MHPRALHCGSKKTTVYAVKGKDTISSNCTVVYESAAIAPNVRHRATYHRHRHHHPGDHARRH